MPSSERTAEFDRSFALYGDKTRADASGPDPMDWAGYGRKFFFDNTANVPDQLPPGYSDYAVGRVPDAYAHRPVRRDRCRRGAGNGNAHGGPIMVRDVRCWFRRNEPGGSKQPAGRSAANIY